jgi:hypothetical protein
MSWKQMLVGSMFSWSPVQAPWCLVELPFSPHSSLRLTIFNPSWALAFVPAPTLLLCWTCAAGPKGFHHIPASSSITALAIVIETRRLSLETLATGTWRASASATLERSTEPLLMERLFLWMWMCETAEIENAPHQISQCTYCVSWRKQMP